MNLNSVKKRINGFIQANGIKPTHLIMSNRSHSTLLFSIRDLYEKPNEVFEPIEKATGLKLLISESIPYGEINTAFID